MVAHHFKDLKMECWRFLGEVLKWFLLDRLRNTSALWRAQRFNGLLGRLGYQNNT